MKFCFCQCRLWPFISHSLHYCNHIINDIEVSDCVGDSQAEIQFVSNLQPVRNRGALTVLLFLNEILFLPMSSSAIHFTLMALLISLTILKSPIVSVTLRPRFNCVSISLKFTACTQSWGS